MKQFRLVFCWISVVLCAMGVFSLPMLAQSPSSRPDLPIDYVTNFNLAEDGTSFISAENPSQSGYFSYADANAKFAHCTIAGEAYHLPSSAEWNGLLSAYYEYGVNFIKEGLIQKEIETISFGDVKQSFTSDYYNCGNGVSYALRLCKSDESFVEEFPAAPNNKYRCAYRYERVGVMQTEQEPPLDAYIKISVCYLGEDFTGSISDISNEEWWKQHRGRVQECIIPILGLKVAGKLYNYASSGFYWATDKAHYTTIFYSGISTSQFPDKSNLCSVRLFRDKKGGAVPQEPTLTVTPNVFRIKVGQELVLGKDYHVDITPAEYANKYTVVSDAPSVVKVEEGTNKLIALSVGETLVTFKINDTEVKKQISISVVPKNEAVEIVHAPLPNVKDFPDLSLLTGTVNTDKIREYETSLGLRLYEATRWEANAHLYVTPKDKLAQTNIYRVNYYYNPQDGGAPYITAQINCVGSLEEAQHSKNFAEWLKTNGFGEPLKSIALNDGSKALSTTNQDLSLKCWIEKKVFFMIIEPIQKGNGIATMTPKSYRISPIPANDVLHISGMEIAAPISVYTLDGILVYQTVGNAGDELTIPVGDLAEGVYLLMIAGEPHRIMIAR